MAASSLQNTEFVKQRSVRNVMNWDHGLTGILIAYGVSAAAIFVGLFLGRASESRLGLFPFLAIPVLIVAVFLWTTLASPLQRIPIISGLFPYLGLIFTGVFCVFCDKARNSRPE
jgi:hypothetical protein